MSFVLFLCLSFFLSCASPYPLLFSLRDTLTSPSHSLTLKNPRWWKLAEPSTTASLIIISLFWDVAPQILLLFPAPLLHCIIQGYATLGKSVQGEPSGYVVAFGTWYADWNPTPPRNSLPRIFFFLSLSLFLCLSLSP
uniref:Putative secreted peptide n=1 Tax=Rhipicephalus pulchellus TaxID=72859 RepID=L7MC31_RHIPC